MTVHKTKMLRRVTAMVACMLAIVFASTLLCANPAVAAEAANLALNKTAVADCEEASSLGASKAVDGDTASKSSRWSSEEDASASKEGGVLTGSMSIWAHSMMSKVFACSGSSARQRVTKSR